MRSARPLFPLLDFLEIERAQWLSPARLEDLQWRRFKEILRYAYEFSPFYRRRFREAGIVPRDVKDRRDLPKIPVTRREDLRNSAELVARPFRNRGLHRSLTSGSTGRRTTTFFDPRGWLTAKYFLKLRARAACGVRPSDRIAIFTAEETRRTTWKDRLLRCRKFSVFDPIEDLVERLERYRPSILYGFPSHFSLLAREPDRPRPRRLFTSSELLDRRTRRRLEAAFEAEVFDVYGSTELKEIAWECPEHSGYHINADWILVEFVDDGKTEGEAGGKIIVSSLYNYGMPLLRYEIGDRGRALDGACPCGRGLPRMAPTEGREVDYVVLPGGTHVSPYALTCAIENVPGLGAYQIRQVREDRLKVAVVPEGRFTEAREERLRAALGPVLPGVKVEIEKVERIEREPSGKFRIVSSELGGKGDARTRR